jgi:hypothetical protein
MLLSSDTLFWFQANKKNLTTYCFVFSGWVSNPRSTVINASKQTITPQIQYLVANIITYTVYTIYTGSVNSIWGVSVARAPYSIYWPRIYRIRSLAHCNEYILLITLNEGFRCNCIKTNTYVIFVLCVNDQVKWSIYDVIFVLK